MRELGAHSRRRARERSGVASADLGDRRVVGVGRRRRGDRRRARAPAVPDVHPAADAEEALRLVRPIVASGDAVLVKASRAIGLEAVAAEHLSGAAVVIAMLMAAARPSS